MSLQRAHGRALLLWLVLVLGLTHPVEGAGQEVTEPPRVTIVGRVVDQVTRLAITGVTVELVDLGVRLMTDSDGQFEIKGLLTGVYELRLRSPGYRDAEGNFAVMRNGNFVTTLTPLNAAAAVPMGRLVGRVTDVESGAPLQGVRVQVPEIFLDGITGEDGRFVFGSVPPGLHQVEFSNLGYAVRRDSLEVVSGRTSDARVAMSIDPVEVDPIEVIVERRELSLERQGFYERREVGLGDFIDREQIELQNPQGVTDLFTRINGAEVRSGDGANPLMRAIVLRGGRRDMSASGGPCYPSVYLDGMLVHRSGAVPAYLNELVSPAEVAGIEVFQGGSQTPAQYGGVNSSCGVVVIWTRS